VSSEQAAAGADPQPPRDRRQPSATARDDPAEGQEPHVRRRSSGRFGVGGDLEGAHRPQAIRWLGVQVGLEDVDSIVHVRPEKEKAPESKQGTCLPGLE